ncbi:MAG: DUF2058 family protein [Alphaproteobacteria bacterium]|nr:DUF2058 family protein [Alphaproteobacteria bacterium]
MSLRDALLQAGVVSKKQVNKANRDLKKARKAEQGHREKKSVLRAREQEEARARADTRREERLEARRRLRDLQEAQARTHRVRQLVRHHGVTGTRGAPIRFHHRALQGDTLHCMELPLSLARGLADGRNGIAALVQPYLDDTEYYVVPRHVAERIAEVDPGAIILLNDERPDDDPAAGFIDDFVPRTPWDPDQPWRRWRVAP